MSMIWLITRVFLQSAHAVEPFPQLQTDDAIYSPHQEILIPYEPSIRHPNKSTGLPNATVYGYLPYWSTSPSNLSFDGLSHVAYFSVGLNSDGSLSETSRWTNIASTLVSRAHAQGVKVHLCLTSFSDSVNNVVLPSASKRATAVANLASLINQYGADGVNIDIEGMDGARRNDLISFILELKAQIPEIVIATPAIDWNSAYDYATLSQHASLFIMGYDYHWSGGDPGPVDPLFGGSPWGRYSLEWTVNDYIDKGADANAIIVGLPLYGRKWNTTNSNIPGTSTGSSSSMVMKDAVVVAATDGSSFDSVTHTPYVLYPTQQLWYQDIDSVRERVSWSIDQGVQGVGFWALGYENGVHGFWEMMADETYWSVSEPSVEPSVEPSAEPSVEPSTEPSTDTSSNQAPVSKAGADIEVEFNSIVELDGGHSYDPDGDSITYNWTMIDDSSIQLLNANTVNPSFIADELGTWQIQLAVSDGEFVRTDRLTVSVVESTDKKSSCAHFSSLLSWQIWLPLAGMYTYTFSRRRKQKTM